MNALTQDIFTGGIVSIAVGPDEIPFDAHIELVCAHSPYFDKALEGRFEEPGTQYLTLPDDEPSIFTKILSWMYNTRLGISSFSTVTTYEELCKIWLLAGKFQMTDLQDQIIDAIKRKYEKALTGKGNLDPSLIKLVYEQTLESSKLRQLVVAMSVWDMEYEHFSKHISQFPPGFKDDYALKQAERGRGNFAAKMPLISEPESFYTRTKDTASLMKQRAISNPPTVHPDENAESFRARKGERTFDSERQPSPPPDQPRAATPGQLLGRKIKTPKRRSASGAPVSPSPSSRQASATPPVDRSQPDVDSLADHLEGQHLDDKP